MAEIQQICFEPPKLSNLIENQASLISLNKYQDELHTIKQLHTLPQKKRRWLRRMTQHWLEQVSKSTKASSNSQRSKFFRAEGNREYTSTSANRDVLLACQYYTKAIFAAGNQHEDLCLAYANRAIALQDFGYYQQAYDDCEYALEFGYPPCRQHKIVMRQAFCAFKLNNKVNLEQHLNSLAQMKLNNSFQKQFIYLKLRMHDLMNEQERTKEDIFDLNRYSQKIVTKPPPRGRHMVATADIAEKALIFNELVTSFVPVGEPGRICQHCSVVLNLMPIPCTQCHGNVIYCSRKCCQAHAAVHRYECAGYCLGIFQQIGITHLAFRTVLDCLPEAMPYLQQKTTADELWQMVMVPTSDVEVKDSARTWHMSTHLNKMHLDDILWFALTAELLKDYLLTFTDYFTQFKATASSSKSWQLFLSALILRGIGQLINNGHTSITIVPKSQTDFPLFQSKLWISPYHVRRGKLHLLCSNYNTTASMNLPYLSLCNHACSQSLQLTFNGRVVSAYAATTIPAGTEITNCYTLDFRKSKCCDRRKQLLETYYFTCECAMCKRQQPDKDHDLFHRYHCEYANCKEVFVAKLPDAFSRFSVDNDSKLDTIICSSCRKTQTCNKLYEFQTLLLSSDTMSTSKSRLTLYASFDTLHTWMVNYNYTKLCLAFRLVDNCFAALEAGAVFTDFEFEELLKILKFCLKGIAAQSGVNTIEYVTQFSFLWDIIALGKYKPARDEIHEMLSALNIIADEYQMLYRNYYKDFIENLFI